MKGKSVDTKFVKPLVIRQPNAIKFQKPSVSGKPTPFSNSVKKKDFSTSRSVPTTYVKKDLSKSVTPQILSEKEIQIKKNTNVIAPGVIPTTSISRPQLKSTRMKDRVMQTIVK
ncbi:hypothetical protein Tco_0945605 [Tanacetum coccineum]